MRAIRKIYRWGMVGLVVAGVFAFNPPTLAAQNARRMGHPVAGVIASRFAGIARAGAGTPRSGQSYPGFDKNEYPGDGELAGLRKSFAWTGYWLNEPPGAPANSWRGKRERIARAGLGFALLFNGKLSGELSDAGAAKAGEADGKLAVASARKEGFGAGSIIFLDVEEGGRLLAKQKAYLFAWADAVGKKGFRAGVYCSGIAVPDGAGRTITTARAGDPAERGGAASAFVGGAGCVSSGAGVRERGAAYTGREWDGRGGDLAVCAVAAAGAVYGGLREDVCV